MTKQFKIHSPFHPCGDQPQAIEKLSGGIKSGIKHQVLLGVTGSGKTYTMAKVIEKTQKPALIISHNKTLAAQLYQEFKEFFPGNAVHYFVSYYDYYQPEAYIPQTDVYIEKDSKINKEIDRLRHAAVQDLSSRKDVIVVASVSCIYNIGSPEIYQNVSLEIKDGQKIKRRDFLWHLNSLQYQRNDIDFKPGTFRVRGDTVEIFLVTGEKILKIEFFGEKIEKISASPSLLEYKFSVLREKIKIFPANFWVTPEKKLAIAAENIKLELQEQLDALKKSGKLLEAQRLAQRTNYDLEMMKESGYCYGIENYSRHLEFRKPGQSPHTLIDYFPDGFIVFVDESHMTLPQIRAMASQDRARKKTLIEYGFRLPSAIDNRPLTFEEFENKTTQKIYVSATPSEYEKSKAVRQKGGKKHIIEQLIRPTGLVEPKIEMRPAENQIKNLVPEIKKTVKEKQRVLVIALTKRLAEAVSEHLTESGIKSCWLHSEVKTLERPSFLKDLRSGKYDVMVGINLLREGLDLPEVRLIAILDADKEGFLRNETALIQIMGRAARNKEGRIILYAGKKTKSIKSAIQEIERRRKIQENYNKIHGIKPQAIVKKIREWSLGKLPETQDVLSLMELKDIEELKKEIKKAVGTLDFEKAAQLRDLIKSLKKNN